MKNQNIVAIIIIAVIVILVVATGIYFAVRASNKKNLYGCGETGHCLKMSGGKYTDINECNKACRPTPPKRYNCDETGNCLEMAGGKYTESTCNNECSKPNTMLTGIKNSLMNVCTVIGGDPSGLKNILDEVKSFSDLKANAFKIDWQINKCYKGPAEYADAFYLLSGEMLTFFSNVDDKAYAALYSCMSGDIPPSTFADLLACLEKSHAASSILGAIEAVLIDLCSRGWNKSQTTTLRTIFAKIKTFQDLADQAGAINATLASCYNRNQIKSIMGNLVSVISGFCSDSSERLCSNLNNCSLSINQDNPDLANFIVCIALALLAEFS